MASLKQKREKVTSFKGCMVASVTPFKNDGKIDEEAVGSYFEYLINIGAKGAYVHGTTGEGVSLNHDEKKSLTRRWVEVVKKSGLSFLLVINVSSCCLEDVVDHAKLCEELDVDAIAFLPPFYYRPRDACQLAKYVETVCESVADIPVFYYHFPEMTGVRVVPSQWIPFVAEKCSNFSAVKYTDRDMSELARCINMFQGKVTFYPGYEDTILTASAIGARAFIGALYNLPEGVKLNESIVKAIEQGNLSTANSEQGKFSTVIDDIFSGAGLVANLKLKLSANQINVGLPRPPIHYK